MAENTTTKHNLTGPVSSEQQSTPQPLPTLPEKKEVTEKKFDEKKVEEVLQALQKSRDRWCAETVDDAEEMWQEIPGLLQWAVAELTEALGRPVFRFQAIYGVPGREIDVSQHIQITNTPKVIKVRTYATNTTYGNDPAPGIAKRLKFSYAYGSTNKTEVFQEGTNVMLDIELV